MMRVDHENFEEWKSSPTGEIFFAALSKEAEKIKQAYLDMAWNGNCNAELFHQYKARAELCFELSQIDAATLQEMIDDEDSNSDD